MSIKSIPIIYKSRDKFRPVESNTRKPYGTISASCHIFKTLSLNLRLLGYAKAKRSSC